MARSPSGRRGRGASDLGGTLGSLLRSTLEQAGAVREAFERSARTGLGDRRRTNLLADLGEVVLELVRQGEIDLEELPEIRDAIDALDRHDEGGRDVPRARSTRITRGYGERDDASLRRAVAQTPRYPFDERDVVARKRGSGDPEPGDEEEIVEFDNELEQEGAEHAVPDVAPRGRRGDPEELEPRGLDSVAREAVTQRLRSFTDPLRRAFARGFDRGEDGEGGEAGEEEVDRDDRDDRDDAELLAAAARGEGLDDRDDLSAARRHGRDRQAGPTRPGYLKKGEAILRSMTGQAAAPRRRESTDDGTVSSASWRRDPAAKTQRVWRPVFDDVPEAGAAPSQPAQGAADAAAAPATAPAPAATASHSPPGAASAAPKPAPIDEPVEIPGVVRYDDLHSSAEEPERPSRPSPLAPRSGGISFDDDEDLEQYMHPDDVPQKPGPT